MFYVYVIKSKFDESLYIGQTDDLRGRFKEHNLGQSQYTKNKKPWALVYYEAYFSKSDAITREKRLKKFKNSYTELKKRLAKSMRET